MKDLTKKEQKAILDVAKQHIFQIAERGDLESHGWDSEDFIDLAVWCLKDALEAAYSLGFKNGSKEGK